jgi:hypothetical protein
MTLLERIDIALLEVGAHGPHTHAELAEMIGITRQAIQRLRRRVGSTLSLEHTAEAARALDCDLYWLCTGKGGHYVPAKRTTGFSFLATEVAKILDAMEPPDRERAFALVYQMSRGAWPRMTEVEAGSRPHDNKP